MRKYLLIGLLFTVLHSISQPGGSLVPGFGSFGVAASTTHSLYEKVVVQPDGKVVVISVHPQFFSNGGAIREIIRFNTDGTRDMNFGVSGSIILQPWYQLSDGSFRQLHLDVEDIAIQPDGKIVATAETWVFRFLAENGAIDVSFGNESYHPYFAPAALGVLRVDIFGFVLHFNTIAVDVQGRIVAAGKANSGLSTWRLVITRINSDGSFDNGLFSSGRRLHILGDDVYTNVLKCTTDNNSRILISVEKYSRPDFRYQSFIYRFKQNGDIDIDFNGDGIVGSWNIISSFAVNKANGKVAYTLMPRQNPPSQHPVALMLLNAAGSLEDSIELTGGLSKNVSSVCFQDDGRIVVGGTFQLLNTSHYSWMLERYAPDGNIDKSFGTGGRVTTSSGLSYHLNDLTIHNNRIYAAGYLLIPEDGNYGLLGVYFGTGVYISCPTSQTISMNADQCYATAGNLDPVVIPSNSPINLTYQILHNGATTSGPGSVSGKQFAKGVSTVTYSYNDGTSHSCNFNITVTDQVAPIARCKNITIALNSFGNATITADQINNGSTDNCGIKIYQLSKSSFDCNNVGPNEVNLTVKDSSDNISSCTAIVTVVDNTAPQTNCKNISVGLDASGNATISAMQIDNGSTDACGIKSRNVSKTQFDCSDVGVNQVLFTVTDNNNNTATCMATVTVVDRLFPTALSKNAIVQLDATGHATVTASQIDNSSYDNCGIKSLGLDKSSFDCSNVGVNTIHLIVTDNNDNVSTCAAMVTVEDKIPPVINNVSASPGILYPVNHQLMDVKISYTPQDNCPGILSAITGITVVDNGIGGGTSATSPDWEIVDAHRVRLRAERPGNGTGRSYFITVRCTDPSGNFTTTVVEVKVVHNIKSPASGQTFLVGSSVNFTGEFWDKAGKTHTAKWLVDGNSAGNGTVTEPSGNQNGKVTGNYKFNTAGVYKLQMNVSDNTGVTSHTNTSGDLESIIVIYDPNGGYTYGGGWYPSQPGALVGNPAAQGKASYGFTVNYIRNSTYPKGETQFEFAVGDFEFNAVNFDYMVISNSMAQFSGTGKITGGQSGVEFIMTVIDGQLDGSGIDRIRMKIYNKNTGAIFYDNQPGASDAVLPVMAVGANSAIVIQGNYAAPVTKAVSLQTLAEPSMSNQFDVHIYPNPATNNFNMLIRSIDLKHKIFIEVFDRLGRLVEKKNLPAGSMIRFGELYRPGTYYMKVIQGDQLKKIKLIKLSD